MDVVTVHGVPAVRLGRYALVGTFRRTGEAAGARPNVLVLVKVDATDERDGGK